MALTNRDLYRSMHNLFGRLSSAPPLDEYLRSLWAVVWEDAAVDPALQPSAERLLQWCEDAFMTPPPAFNLEWIELKHINWYEEIGFAEWECTILRQVADLWLMDSAGTLDQPGLYFGADSPSGARWYNFGPPSYLEAAITGVFGGYKGAKVYELPPLSWGHMCHLMICGQIYE
ncbi:MAG TPA: hypothetical protein VD886_09355 [Herpetosiphonaceae bacterium]|nr:hypothetical protein [Herpetosiphonaceae bacterium]